LSIRHRVGESAGCQELVSLHQDFVVIAQVTPDEGRLRYAVPPIVEMENEPTLQYRRTHNYSDNMGT
jgi:hypothetical protein